MDDSVWLALWIVGGVVAIILFALVTKVPLGYNIRNLLVRWKTTAMTALAFTLVVALLVVMVAFVNGMSRLTEQSGQPGNVIILSDGATDEQFSNLGYSDASDVALQPGIVRDPSGRPLASREVYLVVNQPLPAVEGERPRRRFVQVRGIEDPRIAAAVHGIGLEPGGQWFSEAGVETLPGEGEVQAIQAVIGPGVARELGRDRGVERLGVGGRFTLGGREWTVVGVTDASGSTFGSEIWAKAGLVGPMFGKNTFTSIVVRTKDAAAAKTFAQDLKDNYKKAAIAAQVESEYFANLSSTNQQFLVAIQFVTAVMAIGGVFGVMNTMFAAVSQRIKDIGVLRILGFARWRILVSFLIESLLIALAGGLLGCAIGSLANGWTASSIVSSGAGGGGKFVVLKLVVTLGTLATGLLLALAMGAIGGLVPAIAAMRVRPLESLR